MREQAVQETEGEEAESPPIESNNQSLILSISCLLSESVTEEVTEEIFSPEPASLRSTMREEPI